MHDAVEFLEAELQGRNPAPVRRIVDQDIDPAQVFRDRGIHVGHSLFVGHVGDIDARPPACSLYFPLHRFCLVDGTPRIDGNGGAKARQFQRGGPAGPANRPGDQRCFAGQRFFVSTAHAFFSRSLFTHSFQ